MIGGSPDAGIPIAGLDEQEVAAYISLHEEQLYIHHGKMGVPVKRNQETLTGTASLSQGDTLQVASTIISCSEEKDGITLQISQPDEEQTILPPKSAAAPTGKRIITPTPFHPGPHKPPSKLPPQLKRPLLIMLGVLFLFLAYAVWFVFTARQVIIQIDPKPERISIQGALLTPRFGASFLLRSGNYFLKALKQGYHPIEQPLTVTDEKSQQLKLVMEKLPGRLTITAHQEGLPSLLIDGATIYLDGNEIGVTPLSALEVKAGLRQLVVKAEFYQALESELEIEGMGILQTLNLPLLPGWAEVTIDTLPPQALVSIDGAPRGETPLRLKLAAGTYELKITAERYKTWQTQLEVQAQQPPVLDTIQLQPADGTLALTTKPSGANVTVGGTFVGQTPIDISLEPDTDHTLKISKAGYENSERRVRVATAGLEKLNLVLVPRKGIVHFNVTPEGAELFINGKSQGAVPQSLQLTAVTQRLKIVKKGYEPYQATITPRPGFPQEVLVTLTKKGATTGISSSLINAANGYQLILIQPTSFTMGSSRREQGRRSNESLREVVLKRPFYMGLREVTNKEFRRYLASHDSGSFKSHSLNQEGQPAVQVSWEQAALFCNWLSEKEKLPPVYKKQGGKLLPQEPLSAGYRLPTEAEWEYCVRFGTNKASLVYPWGNSFPPTANTLNIADVSAKDLLPAYLDKYRDGYPVAAPPGSFKANALGLYDAGGNVAEWCHDYYSIYSYAPNQRYEDPTGPQEGKHHLVKDSSWRQSSISILRSAYRDYSDDKRIDVGFRICRYAQ
jgi:formylglycine-generating enzyme required for sulfatase activity